MKRGLWKWKTTIAAVQQSLNTVLFWRQWTVKYFKYCYLLVLLSNNTTALVTHSLCSSLACPYQPFSHSLSPSLLLSLIPAPSSLPTTLPSPHFPATSVKDGKLYSNFQCISLHNKYENSICFRLSNHNKIFFPSENVTQLVLHSV